MSSLLNRTSNQSVHVLPAQRSLVLADSKYRRRLKVADEQGNITQVEVETESPYDFQARLASALVGKEIIYQKLYWNQPLFSHSNESCELRFQINGDTSKTYVVYAIPFMMYTEYDGNSPGIPWGIPQDYSYAKMMELGFNGDVRLLNSNLTLTVPPPPQTDAGYLYDAQGFKMKVNFRYSPVQGFSISFGKSINPSIPVYTIRLLECSYISNAHFVHGFGIYDASSGSSGFVPRNSWTVAYFSDDTPNLLPIRYITIRSDELTKDRRMISFQNANSNRFNNELAIIALSPIYTGTYHTDNVGDDATVISKRDDYQPQVFRITITDENGKPFICDDPINNLLQTPDIVSDETKNSFLFGDQKGRGNSLFVNNLIFGARNTTLATHGTDLPVSLAQSTVNTPNGVIGYLNTGNTLNGSPRVGSQKIMSKNFYTWWNDPIEAGAHTNIPQQCIPIIFNPAGAPVAFPAFPDSYSYAGLNAQVTASWPFTIDGYTPASILTPEQSNFLWDPVKNSTMSVTLDAHLFAYSFVAGGDITKFANVYVFIVAWSTDFNDFVLASNAIEGLSFYPALGFLDFSVDDPEIPLYINPLFAGTTTQQHISFYFCFQNSLYGNPTIPGTAGFANVGMDFQTQFPPAIPRMYFFNRALEGQTDYIPPEVNQDIGLGYEFGNPQATAKCEELIHEIVLVLDKN